MIFFIATDSLQSYQGQSVQNEELATTEQRHSLSITNKINAYAGTHSHLWMRDESKLTFSTRSILDRTFPLMEARWMGVRLYLLNKVNAYAGTHIPTGTNGHSHWQMQDESELSFWTRSIQERTFPLMERRWFRAYLFNKVNAGSNIPTNGSEMNGSMSLSFKQGQCICKTAHSHLWMQDELKLTFSTRSMQDRTFPLIEARWMGVCPKASRWCGPKPELTRSRINSAWPGCGFVKRVWCKSILIHILDNMNKVSDIAVLRAINQSINQSINQFLLTGSQGVDDQD